MSKKIIYILSLVLLMMLCGCMKEPDHYLHVTFNEVHEFEYGSKVYIKDLIESIENGTYDNKKIDTSVIGEQEIHIEFFTSYGSEGYTRNVSIVDTKYPTIELKQDQVKIKEGQKIDVLDYVKEIKDEIDGRLSYNKEIKKGSYTYEGKLDTTKAGTYVITFIALDINNNKTTKELKVTIEENKEQSNTQDQYDENIFINKNKIIVINAGHQAKGNSSKEANSPATSIKKAKVTTGATGQFSKVKESQINLEIALKLQDELESRGYTVIMTRTSQDVNISNKERAMIGNNHQASAVIHIHCDSIDDSSIHGAHTISISKNNPAYPGLYNASRKLAKSVINSYCDVTGMKNRGAKTSDDLTGLNWSQVPAIYIETGFLSNKSDDLNLANDDFQYLCAKGIANGIDDYFR